jgi:D-alanyl-lipoteichoic acid acyltransferase DltB (MBOAT superfamily)
LQLVLEDSRGLDLGKNFNNKFSPIVDMPIIFLFLFCFCFCFFSVNHLDIAPQYASLIMGLSNTVATLPGIVSPALTGYIVQNKVIPISRM